MCLLISELLSTHGQEHDETRSVLDLQISRRNLSTLVKRSQNTAPTVQALKIHNGFMSVYVKHINKCFWKKISQNGCLGGGLLCGNLEGIVTPF